MTAAPVPGRTRALGLIAFGQLLVLSLWFSASAVSPQLAGEWELSASAETGLTLFVQIGFVAGALLISASSIADSIPSRRLFVSSAIVASLVNLGLLAMGEGTVEIALGLRFLTGMLIAGVYPAGLKVMSGWFRSNRGMALGVLVGALTVGSATPHLVRGIGLEWRGVVISSSVLALAGALLMTRVGDGPFEVARQPFRWGQALQAMRSRGVRLSTFGYLGHMWELYAMWTWMAAFLAASSAEAGGGYGSISILTFGVIAIGGLGSWVAGLVADRWGRTMVAGGAMAISGTCALATPLIFGASAPIVIPVVLLWGITVVADSAQFSTMVTEVASQEVRGTALTLQTALGFLLTLVTIRGVPLLADALTWRWAFPVLAVGPALGVVAMARLRRSPDSVRLAAGRG
jgi:MFS family permease